MSTKTEGIFIFPEPLNDLPEPFQFFWEDWYAASREHAADFFQLLLTLEKLLFESPNEILTHPVANEICRALRFWRLQIQRKQAAKHQIPNGSPNRDPNGNPSRSPKVVNLKILVETWELFQSNFMPRVAQHKNVLTKAFAVIYSFTGLSIIKNIDKGALPKQSSASLLSPTGSPSSQESIVEHSWVIDLLTAKFQKTIGHLSQAEDILQKLTEKLQQSPHNAIYGSALFELCDVYMQMEEKGELLHATVRKLLLQNPSSWDFALAGSLFCNELLQKWAPKMHKEFAPNDPVALNWAGLYALADGKYGPGNLLSHQVQKNYWGQILQLKKAINDQRIAGSNDFYSLQRAQLLIYYILILEHLSLARKAEKSAEVLEKNSLLWQDVMIEIYSLSEEISQRCKHRFSPN